MKNLDKKLIYVLYIILFFIVSSCRTITETDTVFIVSNIIISDDVLCEYQLQCQNIKGTKFYFNMSVVDTIDKYNYQDTLFLSKH